MNKNLNVIRQELLMPLVVSGYAINSPSIIANNGTEFNQYKEIENNQNNN
ncbi:hypothetical protein [Vibrio alginolyticus]|nr:hypothetical protein [Vibrio alginolyticus]